MALTVGKLAVELDARTNEFRSELGKAERRLEKVERQADKSTKGIASSFARLAGGAGLVIGAIGAIGGAIAAIGFGKFAIGGIKAAATFEQIGVQLEVLTGNAEGAKQVLDDVNKLVVETPFGLEQLAKAASSVAVVFGENTEQVSEFTGIAADIAAAFGKPVEEVGINLQKAFASGLGAAEQFRDIGLTGIIQDITGETEVANISTQQLADALREVTAEGGKAYGAAAKQAATLGGVISNVTINFENFQRAFGAAVSPQVTAILRDVVIPIFARLEQLVLDNTDRIREMAQAAIPILIQGFVRFTSIIASVIRGLGWIKRAFAALQVGGAVLQAWVVSMIADFKLLGSIVFNSGLIIGKVVAAIGLALIGDFKGARLAITDIQSNWDSMKETFEQGSRDTETAIEVVKDRIEDVKTAGDGLDSFADSLENGARKAALFAKGAIAAADATGELNEETKKTEGDKGPSILEKSTTAQIKGSKTLEDLLRKRLRLSEGELTTHQKLLNSLDDQIRKVRELKIEQEDEVDRMRLVKLLEDDRTKAIEDRKIAVADVGLLEEKNAAAIARLARFDPETAAELAKQMTEALQAAKGDPAKQLEIAQDFAKQIAEALGEVVPPRLSEALAGSLTGTFREVLEGEATSFTDNIGNLLFDRASDAMDRAFNEAAGNFEKVMTQVLDGLGDKIGGLFDEGGLLGGLGETLGIDKELGGLVGNAAIGLLGAGFKALTQEEGTAQAGRVQSAVTSAERVRGIVAGPTQIAVAQVDRAIADAFVETNVILERIEVNTRRTATQSAPSGGGSIQAGGTSEATAALANESPTLV